MNVVVVARGERGPDGSGVAWEGFMVREFLSFLARCLFDVGREACARNVERLAGACGFCWVGVGAERHGEPAVSR